MASSNSSSEFVELLRDLKCPGANEIQGKDIDWLWETPAKSLIEWMCNNITAEDNGLTEEEVAKWATFPKEDILRGEKLEDALANLEVEAKDEDPRTLEDLRDELDLRQDCINDLQNVKSNLNTHQGRLTLMLNALNKKLESSESNLASEQRKLLKLNSDLENALQKLKSVIETAKSQDGFVSADQDLPAILEEDDKARTLICDLIHKRFDEPLGRDMEEFNELVNEAHRQRFSLESTEIQRILAEAQVNGLTKGLEETKSQLRLLAQNLISKSNIQQQIDSTEKEILNVQKDIKSLAKDQLPKAVKEQVANQCKKLLYEDLKGKSTRQRFVIDQLQKIKNLLLELTSGHEIFGGYLAHESKMIQRLESCLSQVKELNNTAKSDILDDQVKVKNLIEKESNFAKRSTLVPYDKGLLLLYKMTTGKELDPSMITYDDIICILNSLTSERDSLDQLINGQCLRWQQQRDEIRGLLHKLLKEVGITEDSKGYHLASHKVKSAIKSAQNEVAELEVNVKEAIAEWEKAYKNLKENPMLKLEKDLWKDFMINKPALEKTMETMKYLHTKRLP